MSINQQKPGTQESQPAVHNGDITPVFCIVGECSVHVWGMSTSQRHARAFARHGVHKQVSLDEAVCQDGPVIVIRADAIIDQPLIAVLASRRGLLLQTEPEAGGQPLAATVSGKDSKAAAAIISGGGDNAGLDLVASSPSQLNLGFWADLRKQETPYALIATDVDLSTLEWRMFMGTYKGSTDFVTRYLWPRPAFYVTRILANTPVTPNMVTSVSAVFVLAAIWFFLRGDFWLGLASAWLMTFLDTVDGKLARTTLTSTRWGNIFDHGIDLVHPPFWYAAWAYGLTYSGFAWSGQFSMWVVGIIVAGYVAQRLMEGIAITWLGFEIHIWRRIDSLFRVITARRNPNLAILTVAMVFARPDLGLIAVAVWTLVCLVLHGIQLAQALLAHKKTGPLGPWMAQDHAQQ